MTSSMAGAGSISSMPAPAMMPSTIWARKSRLTALAAPTHWWCRLPRLSILPLPTYQSSGDAVTVTNFETLEASAVTTALTVTGSSAANIITTGSGGDTIDSGGGADVIDAGAGNDSIFYRGTEASIDAGTGTDTLV